MTDFAQVAEYALLMRVPLITAAVLVLLPVLARTKSMRPLLLGLFDVTPPSMIAVTLAASTVAGIVADNARVIYYHSFDRGVGGLGEAPPHVSWVVWLVIAAVLELPVIVFTIWFSNKQNAGKLGVRIWLSIGTLGFGLCTQQLFVNGFKWLAERYGWSEPSNFSAILGGYSPIKDHVTAAAGFAFALACYVGLGLYGYTRLGKKRTVPALCSALMVLMMACSTLSAISFFLDLWHVPVLAVLVAWAFITTQSIYSDHYYSLQPRSAVPALSPLETLRATKREQGGRVILVAANGGGIQAAAWTAYVLEELEKVSARFAGSLRLISSVSGGSLGSACYTYKRAQGAKARDAFDAASMSSLDEVAWGVGWPDLISSIVPWVTKNFIGRGRALETAWCSNCAATEDTRGLLDRPLSEWNAGVKSGDLPAVIMNATIVESGQRLLFGTTRFDDTVNCRARVDAERLHGGAWDVSAVTAARLSATFPYVTPASRSKLPGPRPHVVDGGYYDNFGMATLVEWLDEALVADQNAGAPMVESVLVIQLHGAPVDQGSEVPQGKVRNRGWVYQLLAPLLTLDAVRGAGQAAHNDLELEQLQEKWFQRKVPVHTVTLEYPDEQAPLSWHLTKEQKDSIVTNWAGTDAVVKGSQKVAAFLVGSDSLECPCPTCQMSLHPVQNSQAAGH